MGKHFPDAATCDLPRIIFRMMSNCFVYLGKKCGREISLICCPDVNYFCISLHEAGELKLYNSLNEKRVVRKNKGFLYEVFVQSSKV